MPALLGEAPMASCRWEKERERHRQHKDMDRETQTETWERGRGDFEGTSLFV